MSGLDPVLRILLSIVLEVLDSSIRQEKEIQSMEILKEEIKLSHFAGKVFVYIKSPKDYTHTDTQIFKN